MANRDGWIKIHRKILDDPQFKDPDALAVWMHLLLRANYKQNSVPMGNKKVIVNRGQLICGRKALAEQTGVQESKIERLLKRWISEQQIEQQSFNKFRLISIVKYNDYQIGEQQNDGKVNTEKEVKNNNKENAPLFVPPSAVEVAELFAEKGFDLKTAKEEAEKFMEYYGKVNWLVGRSKKQMTSWKLAVANWKRNKDERDKKNTRPKPSDIDFGSTGWSG